MRWVLLEKIRICFIFKNSFTSQNKCQVLQWVPQNNTGTPSFRFCTDAQQSHTEKLSPGEAEGPGASTDHNALQSQCRVVFWINDAALLMHPKLFACFLQTTLQSQFIFVMCRQNV